MHSRCKSNYSPTARVYKDRGITVCGHWATFENFVRDMGERPAGMTLDRKNNDLGYTPKNCQWATPQQQRMNQRAMKAKQ
jgi:hypothetical protein